MDNLHELDRSTRVMQLTGKPKLKSLKSSESVNTSHYMMWQKSARPHQQSSGLRGRGTGQPQANPNNIHSMFSSSAMEMESAILDVSLTMQKLEISKLKKKIALEMQEVIELERINRRKNNNREVLLKAIEKKSNDAKALFEKEHLSNQAKDAFIQDLNDNIANTIREIAKNEELLSDYKRYKDVLFKLAPPEWQEAQKAEALLHTRSSAHKNTPDTNSTHDSVENQEKVYFNDPEEVIEQLVQLSHEDVSRLERTYQLNATAKHGNRKLDAVLQQIKKEEDRYNLEEKEMSETIHRAKKTCTMFKTKVKLHDSLKETNEDVMLKTLDAKAAEVYKSFKDHNVFLTALDKLAAIEKHLMLLLIEIDKIPKDTLKEQKCLNDRIKKDKEREERMRIQEEQRRQRLKKCVEKTMSEPTIRKGRKLMARSFPVKSPEIPEEQNSSDKDSLYEYLFGEPDNDY